MRKTCTKCGLEKDFAEFAKSSKGDKHGLRAQCRECCGSYNRAWNKANPERMKVAYSTYRARVREDAGKPPLGPRPPRRSYETIAAQKRAWVAANPERVREHKRTEYLRHRDKYIARAAAWKAANLEKSRASTRRGRAREHDAPGTDYTTVEMIAARIAMFGGRCYYCGCEDADAIDHRIPLSRGGPHWPSNLVPCCKSCNSSKNNRTEAEYRRALKGVIAHTHARTGDPTGIPPFAAPTGAP